MAELGVSGDVIDECLNHVIESEVRRIYVRDRREPDQARAFDALGQRLSQIFADSSDEVDRWRSVRDGTRAHGLAGPTFRAASEWKKWI